MNKLLLLISLIIINFYGQQIHAQIAINPIASFIDPVSKTGEMDIINTADDVREIDISLKFGYNSYDSTGNQVTLFNDSITEKEFSLNPYIKVFPETLVIPPHEHQTVRFLVTDLPENTGKCLWTRIIAGSIPATPQIESVEKNKVQANMVLKTHMIGLVAYIDGKNNSNVEFNLLKTYMDSIKVNFFINEKVSGNSPFWGTLYTEIYNSANELVGKQQDLLAIYKSCVQKISVKHKQKLKAGKYSVKFTFSNEREEIPEDFRSVNNPGSRTFDFEIH